MVSSNLLSRSKCIWSSIVSNFKTEALILRTFADKSDDGCRRAIVDIPPDVDPVCPKTCKRRSKKEGILHRIKLKVVEGGTNFGSKRWHISDFSVIILDFYNVMSLTFRNTLTSCGGAVRFRYVIWRKTSCIARHSVTSHDTLEGTGTAPALCAMSVAC